MPSFPISLNPLLKTSLDLFAKTRLPKVKGQMKLPGLHASVEVFRDAWGVPHIYAQSLADLMFAQGFVHAQDRFWQMEFNRRLVAGRLSEVLGPATLPVDRWLRTLTMRRVAEYEAQHMLDTETRNLLQAYANGINACITRTRRTVEFTLLRYKPEPWVIADSLAWIKMMSWGLSVNWETELLRSRLIDRLGPELAAELQPPHLGRWPYIVPPGSDYSHIGESALERARAAKPFSGPSPYQGLGSNNWALAGILTTTGKPILANDMHLPINIPSIWYENHLVVEDMLITGVSFPGLPGVVAGHNGKVAWGYTNGFPDVQDLYIERLRRTQAGQVQVEYNGKWEQAQTLQEVIQVKGQEPYVEEVVITRHGPIINALAPDFAGEHPLALRWTSLEPDRMVRCLFEIIRAQNCTDFHQALQLWAAPVQNVVYADTQGNIAYTFAGKIPMRAKGNGQIPVPGWTDEYEWVGYLPYDALPHLCNPPQGYIATANNRTVSEDYPVRLDLEPISGDRAQRIAEMILNSQIRGGQEKIDIPFVQKMHFDQHSPSARVVAHYLSNIPLSQSPADKELRPILDWMKDWGGELAAKSQAAALYEVFIRKMAQTILSPRFNPYPGVPEQGEKAISNQADLIQRFMGKGPTPVLADTSSYGELWLPWLTDLLAQPNSDWFNLGNGETRDDIIRLSLHAAMNELRELLGPQIENWTWGKLHSLNYSHTLGNAKPLAAFFNRGPYPLGGDHTTIWATGTGYHDLDSRRMVGPPFRMIVDLGNLDNSLGLLTPGQSGNPASPHYDDQIEAWFTGDYHPMLINRQKIEALSPNLLRLTPA